MPSISDLKWASRELNCALTKGDLLYFENSFLRPKYPDLYIHEVARLGKRTKVYDSLAEVDREVCFCQSPPDPKIERKRKRTKIENRLPFAYVWPQVRISVNTIRFSDLRKVESSTGVRPVNARAWSFNANKTIGSSYRRDDKEAKKYVDAVFRLARKFMTNWYDWYDLETGELVEKESRSFLWCGPEGVRLSRDAPDFYPLIMFSREHNIWCGAKPLPKD
jgi:hypothetical protein